MDAECLGSRTISKIIPLALPKGAEKLCELCQREAHLQCSNCRVTFYCNLLSVCSSSSLPEQRDIVLRGEIHDEDHQQADWVGIHERICHLLVPIRTQTLLSLKQVGCTEIQLKKVEIIEICRSVAQSKLSEGKHREALPAAQFYLRCSIDVYGPSTVQLVPAYLLLAEANMGLGNLALVTELLSQAEWVVLKSPECGHAVHHRLHRSLGRLHMATGNMEAALLNFANDVYFASEEYGVNSTVTCGGYFLMAGVFIKQGKMTIAHSLYSQVAHIWHCHLTKLFNIHKPNMLLEASHDADLPFGFQIDKAQRLEVDEILRTMLEFEQNGSRKDSTRIALVAHCLAMLWFLGGDSVKALGFGSMALQSSQLIPNLTEPIQGLLQLVQDAQTDPHAGSD